MELFLLIAIGITVISFISIVLTNPSPTTSTELITQPSTGELTIEDETESRDSTTEQNEPVSETKEQIHIEKEIMAPLA